MRREDDSWCGVYDAPDYDWFEALMTLIISGNRNFTNGLIGAVLLNKHPLSNRSNIDFCKYTAVLQKMRSHIHQIMSISVAGVCLVTSFENGV